MSDYERYADFSDLPLFAGATAEDRTRLSAQCVAILDRLRRGPATNVDLNQIAFRYSARIYDLRRAGYTIDLEQLGGGLTRYTLRG